MHYKNNCVIKNNNKKKHSDFQLQEEKKEVQSKFKFELILKRILVPFKFIKEKLICLHEKLNRKTAFLETL